MMQKQLLVVEEKVRGKILDMPKLTKLNDADDIEAYQTTLRERWRPMRLTRAGVLPM